jgi:hypothetical protein
MHMDGYTKYLVVLKDGQLIGFGSTTAAIKAAQANPGSKLLIDGEEATVPATSTHNHVHN